MFPRSSGSGNRVFLDGTAADLPQRGTSARQDARMSTRYLGRSELLTLFRDSRDPLAERASAALDPTDADVVPVHSGGLDRATYEVRFARAEAGAGPATAG